MDSARINNDERAKHRCRRCDSCFDERSSILHEMKRDVLLRVEGKDVDGQPLEVVVTVFEREITIKVITTF